MTHRGAPRTFSTGRFGGILSQPPPMNGYTAKRIVNAVLGELGGRKGFGLIGTLRAEDPAVYQDLYAECVKRVKETWDAASGDDPTDHPCHPR